MTEIIKVSAELELDAKKASEGLKQLKESAKEIPVGENIAKDIAIAGKKGYRELTAAQKEYASLMKKRSELESDRFRLKRANDLEARTDKPGKHFGAEEHFEARKASPRINESLKGLMGTAKLKKSTEIISQCDAEIAKIDARISEMSSSGEISLPQIDTSGLSKELGRCVAIMDRLKEASFYFEGGDEIFGDGFASGFADSVNAFSTTNFSDAESALKAYQKLTNSFAKQMASTEKVLGKELANSQGTERHFDEQLSFMTGLKENISSGKIGSLSALKASISGKNYLRKIIPDGAEDVSFDSIRQQILDNLEQKALSTMSNSSKATHMRSGAYSELLDLSSKLGRRIESSGSKAYFADGALRLPKGESIFDDITVDRKSKGALTYGEDTILPVLRDSKNRIMGREPRIGTSAFEEYLSNLPKGPKMTELLSRMQSSEIVDVLDDSGKKIGERRKITGFRNPYELIDEMNAAREEALASAPEMKGYLETPFSKDNLKWGNFNSYASVDPNMMIPKIKKPIVPDKAEITDGIIDEYLDTLNQSFPQRLKGKKDVLLNAAEQTTRVNVGTPSYEGEYYRDQLENDFFEKGLPIPGIIGNAANFIKNKFGSLVSGRNIFTLMGSMHKMIESRREGLYEGILSENEILSGSKDASAWQKGLLLKNKKDGNFSIPEDVSRSAKWVHAIRQQANLALEGKDYTLPSAQEYDERKGFFIRGHRKPYSQVEDFREESFTIDPNVAMRFANHGTDIGPDGKHKALGGYLAAAMLNPKNATAWLGDEADYFAAHATYNNDGDEGFYTNYDSEREFSFSSSAIKEAFDSGFLREFSLKDLSLDEIEILRQKIEDFSLQMQSMAQTASDAELSAAFTSGADSIGSWIDETKTSNGYNTMAEDEKETARKEAAKAGLWSLVPKQQLDGKPWVEDAFDFLPPIDTAKEMEKTYRAELDRQAFQKIAGIEDPKERLEKFKAFSGNDKVNANNLQKYIDLTSEIYDLKAENSRSQVIFDEEQVKKFVQYQDEHYDDIYDDDRFKVSDMDAVMSAIEGVYTKKSETKPESIDSATAAKKLTEYYKQAKREGIVDEVPKIGKKTSAEEVEALRQQLYDKITAEYNPGDEVLKQDDTAITPDNVRYAKTFDPSKYNREFFLGKMAERVGGLSIQGVDSNAVRKQIEAKNAAEAEAQRQSIIANADAAQKKALDSNLFNTEGIARQVFGNLFEGLNSKEIGEKFSELSYDERDAYTEKLMAAYEERGYSSEISKSGNRLFKDKNGALLPEDSYFLASQLKRQRDDENFQSRFTAGNQESFIPADNGQSFARGVDVGNGYSSGMQSTIGQVQATGEQVGQAGLTGLADGAQSHSDSVFGIARGRDVANGYAHGMLGMLDEVKNAGEQLGTKALTSLEEAISKEGVYGAMDMLRDALSKTQRAPEANEGVSPAFDISCEYDAEGIAMTNLASIVDGQKKNKFRDPLLQHAMARRYLTDEIYFDQGVGYNRDKQSDWVQMMYDDPSMLLGGVLNFRNATYNYSDENGDFLTRPMALFRGLNGWYAAQDGVSDYSSDKAYFSDNAFFDYSPWEDAAAAYAQGEYDGRDYDSDAFMSDSHMIFTLARPIDTLGIGSLEDNVYGNTTEHTDETRVSPTYQRFAEEKGFSYSFTVPDESTFSKITNFAHTLASLADVIGLYNPMFTSIADMLGNAVVDDVNKTNGTDSNNGKVRVSKSESAFSEEQLSGRLRRDFNSPFIQSLAERWSDYSNKQIYEYGLKNYADLVTRAPLAIEDIPPNGKGEKLEDYKITNPRTGELLAGEELAEYQRIRAGKDGIVNKGYGKIVLEEEQAYENYFGGKIDPNDAGRATSLVEALGGLDDVRFFRNEMDMYGLTLENFKNGREAFIANAPADMNRYEREDTWDAYLRAERMAKMTTLAYKGNEDLMTNHDTGEQLNAPGNLDEIIKSPEYFIDSIKNMLQNLGMNIDKIDLNAINDFVTAKDYAYAGNKKAVMRNMTLGQNGKYIGEGVLEGLEDADINSNTQAFVDAIDAAIRQAAGIASPAKAFIPIGEFIALGILQGFQEAKLEETIGQTILNAINQAKQNAERFDAGDINEKFKQRTKAAVRRATNRNQQINVFDGNGNGGGNNGGGGNLNNAVKALNNAAQAMRQAAQAMRNGNGNNRGDRNGRGGGGGVGPRQPMPRGGMFGGLRGMFGFNLTQRALHMASRAIRRVLADVQELDKSITAIATVSNLSADQLWKKAGEYSDVAKRYGTSLNEVYKTSLLYYQQGMPTNEVDTMVGETLKLAKISGTDVSKAADYMTNAFRSFKMEVSEAHTVTDVFANLAANAAVSVNELSEAMSKAATSMEASGASFENTSAFIAMMTETTRESAPTMGAAMQSIAARYSQIKKDPNGITEDNETVKLNDVDKALTSIGIDMQDETGQIRNLDEVIIELSQKWQTLDKNTQSYVATLMAGSRQKARFLALVGNYARLSEMIEEANNSENAAQAQLIKNMDSIETKRQNLQNALQSAYVNIGIQNWEKTGLDMATGIINGFVNANVGHAIEAVIGGITIKKGLSTLFNKILPDGGLLNYLLGAKDGETGQRTGGLIPLLKEKIGGGLDKLNTAFIGTKVGNALNNGFGKVNSALGGMGGAVAGVIGKAVAMGISMATKNMQRGTGRGILQGVGSLFDALGNAFLTFAMTGGNVPLAIASGAISLITGIIGAITDNSLEKVYEDLEKRAEDARNKAITAKQEEKNIDTVVTKLERLKKARYESSEANQEYLDYCNEVASSYPALITAFDEEGNAIVETLVPAYEQLRDTAREALEAEEKAAEEGLKLTGEQQKHYDKDVKSLFGNDDKYQRATEGTFTIGQKNNGEDISFKDWLALGDDERNTVDIDRTLGYRNTEIMDYLIDLSQSDPDAYDKTLDILGPVLPHNYFNGFKSQLANAFDNINEKDKAKAIRGSDLSIFELVDYATQYYSKGNQIGQSANDESEKYASAKFNQGIVEKRGDAPYTENYMRYNPLYENETIAKAIAVSARIGYNNAKKNNGETREFEEWYKATRGAGVKNDDGNHPYNQDDIIGLYAGMYERFSAKQKEDFDNLENVFSNFASANELKEHLKENFDIADDEILTQYGQLWEDRFTTTKETFGQAVKYYQGKNEIGSDYSFENISIAYMDSLTGDLAEIDKLFEAGLKAKAEQYGEAILPLWNFINGLEDVNKRNVLSAWMQESSFTTFDDLYDAEVALRNIGEENGFNVDELLAYIPALREAVDVNMETYLSGLGTAYAKARETIETASSGLSYDKALEQFRSMSNSKIWDDSINFGEIYQMDKESKWQLTAKGVILARRDALDKLETVNEETERAFDQDLQDIETIRGLINDEIGAEAYRVQEGTTQNQQKIIEDIFKIVEEEGLPWEDAEKKYYERLQAQKDTFVDAKDVVNKAVDESTKFTAFKSIDIGKITGLDTSVDEMQAQNSAIMQLLNAADHETYDVEGGADLLTRHAEDLKELIRTGELDLINTQFKSYYELLSTASKQQILDAKITNINTAFEALQKGAGQVIDESIVELFEGAHVQIGNIATQNGAGDWITDGRELSSSQYGLLKEYVKTTTDNIKSVNETLVKIMENQIADESAWLNFAKSAASGNVDLNAIGTIASQIGMDVDKFINFYADYIEKQFDGSYKIKNFDDFTKRIAGQLGIFVDQTAEWYVEQLSASADSAITERTKNGKKAMEQLKAISTAKVGDELNLAYLQNAFSMTEEQLSELLEKLGIDYANGIGEITDNLAILNFKEVIKIAEAYADGNEGIAESMSMLEDAVESAFKNWADLISNGLSGSLTNENAETLRANFGLSEDMFTRTPTGLKMTEEAVAKMYVKIREVDTVAARMTMEKIVSDSKNLGDGIANASDLMQAIEDKGAELASVEKEIIDLENQIGSRIPTENEAERLRLLYQEEKSLKNQLQLYGAMRANALDNPDMWKLSDKELSNPIQANLNAWKSAGDWMDALKKGKGKNVLGVQDFTNMIEFVAQNVEGAAENFMNSGMTAAEVIQKGYEHLKNVDGNTVIDLGKIGINFLSGSESMGENVTKGINNLAQSQVDMLDALIAMLEVIVAMEEMGDIDADQNGEINLEELFPKFKFGGDSSGVIENFEDFNADFENIRKSILKRAKESESLAKALDGLHIAGDISMADLLGIDITNGALVDNTEFLNNLRDAQITYDEYTGIINSLYQAAMSNDYNIENLIQSTMEQLGDYGRGKPIYYEEGNKIISLKNGTTYSINFDEQTTIDRMNEALSSAGGFNNKEEIEEAVKNYLKGEKNIMIDFTTQQQADIFVTMGLITKKKVDVFDENGEKTGTEDAWFFNGQPFSSEEDAAKACARYQLAQDNGGKDITITVDEEKNITVEMTIGVGTKATILPSGRIMTPQGEFSDVNEWEDSVRAEAASRLFPNDGEYKELSDHKKYLVDVEAGVVARKKVDINDDTLTDDKTTADVGQSILKESRDSLQEILNDAEPNGDGTITIPASAFGADIILEEGATVNDLIAAAFDASGINGEIVMAVTTAIGQAFTDPEIAAAITTAISDGVRGAFTEQAVTPDAEAPAIPISGIKIEIAQGGVEVDAATIKSQVHDKLKEVLGEGIDPIEIPIEIIIGPIIPGVNNDNNPTPGVPAGGSTDGTTPGQTATSLTADGSTIEVDSASSVEMDSSTIDGGNFTATDPTITASSSTIDATGSTINGLTLSSAGNGGDGGEGSGDTSQPQGTPVDFSEIVSGATDAASEAGGVLVNDIPPYATTAASAIGEAFKSTMDSIQDKTVTINVDYPEKVSITGAIGLTVNVSVSSDGGKAKGTITSIGGPNASIIGSSMGVFRQTFAKGNAGSAMAGGSTRTLMGELGPEMVVSNGRYFTVGNNGPEFVDLANDAIVFNHLQTEKLLKNGKAPTRGRPYKNEREAVAFAGGNASGPAMASAASALAELKKLRAMWASLAGASAQDLAGSGGGGGGGGGGGDNKAFLADLNEWYNLEKQIERIEKELTLLEKQRATYTNAMVGDGYKYAASLMQSSKQIDNEIKKQERLNELAQKRFEMRKKELADSAWGSFIKFDKETGAVQYDKEGFKFLSKLQEKDKDGKAKLDGQGQLDAIEDYLKNTLHYSNSQVKKFMARLAINPDGSEAKEVDQQVQNFWDNIEAWKSEMESYQEEIDQTNESIADLTKAQQEIAQELLEKRIGVEEKVMQAFTDKIQKEIDALKDHAEAVKKAGEDYINGLNEALEKEKQMYERQQNESELVKLQRQLSILQRTGGSASEINSLQSQINSKLQEKYFQAQQDEIDAVQNALDEQTKALDRQVELQTEALEYQKANGLFWEEVIGMINTMTPEQLSDFVDRNTTSLAEKSAHAIAEELRPFLLDAQTIYGTKMAEDWFDLAASNKNYNETDRETGKRAYASAYSDAIAAGKTHDEAQKDATTAANKAANWSAYSRLTKGKKGAMSEKDFMNLSEEKQNEAIANLSGGKKSSTTTTKKGTTHTKKEYEDAIAKLKWDKDGQPVWTLTKDTYLKKNKTGDALMSKKTKKGTYKITNANVESSKGAHRLQLGSNGWLPDPTPGGFVNAYKLLAGTGAGKMRKNVLEDWIKTKFKKGGIAEFTGPAWLDGTPSKPEAVLSASDYALLKSKIFDNSGSSLKNIVGSITSLMETASNSADSVATNTINSDVTFENVNLTIESGTIASDYDAKRAGQNIMEEMMKIARKSGNISITRR